MSLSWFDRINLYVHPRRVVLEHRSWRGAVRRREALVLPSAPGESDWQPSLAAVAGMLADDNRRGGRVEITVADHFVRYVVLPWSDGINGPRARQTVAHALLRNTLGERVDALEIALDRARFRRPGLAAGIERRFVEELRGAFHRRHIAVSSLQPRLVRELASGGRKLANFDGWFVSADPERLTLARLECGSLVALRNQRSTPDSLGSELGALLAADCQREPGGKLLFCTDGQVQPSILPPWEVMAWPSVLTGAAHA